MLYLIATPIGNLGDLSQRAKEILASCHLIYCEDTRHSDVLLRHYEIRTPTRSYHKFSEAQREEEILSLLKEGKEVALISDAGTPAIADPGERLVKRVIEEGLPVTSIPGPAAFLQALLLSGFSTAPFQFIGFLPKKQGELTETLIDALYYKGTTIAYESPRRIEETVALIAKADPGRKLAVARELTKKFEEVLRGNAEELLPRIRELKGEVILLIDSSPHWRDLPPKELVSLLENKFELPTQDAIKIAAKLLGIQKNAIYPLFF